MSAILRMNHFVEAAKQAHIAPTSQYLHASAGSVAVTPMNLPSSFSEQAKTQNCKTWEIFQESLINIIGQHKFDWICHRYRAKLNFTGMKKSGAPLLPKHVELFSVGAAQVLNRDIKAKFPGKIRALTREQLKERIAQIQPFPILGECKDPTKMTGAPGTTFAHFFHDKLLMDKEKQMLFSDVEKMSLPAYRERLTKIITNRELIEGQIIPAPGHDGHVDYYKVYRKVATGDGLVAYALSPATNNSTLKPLIVFRPSQWALSNEDTFETYLNDVQLNIGEMGWKGAAAEFEKLMSDPHFRRNNEKISISGYSLGGAQAQRFLAVHADHVSYAVFYNDPSVDDETAEKFAQRMNSMGRRGEPLNIQIFRMKGDFCDYIGGKHLGWGVDHPDVNIQLMEGNFDDKKAAAFKLHSHRVFDNTTFPYYMQRYDDTQQLFDRLDNSKRGPDVLWYERMRRIWGKVTFASIYSLSVVVKFISWALGVRILRSSKDPDL